MPAHILACQGAPCTGEWVILAADQSAWVVGQRHEMQARAVCGVAADARFDLGGFDQHMHAGAARVLQLDPDVSRIGQHRAQQEVADVMRRRMGLRQCARRLRAQPQAPIEISSCSRVMDIAGSVRPRALSASRMFAQPATVAKTCKAWVRMLPPISENLKLNTV